MDHHNNAPVHKACCDKVGVKSLKDLHWNDVWMNEGTNPQAHSKV